jgi:hypothetical protein
LVTTFDAQLAQGASVPSVTALEVGGSVYAGGSFTTAAGQSRNKLVALDAVTGSPTAWNPNLVASMIYNAPVLSLLLHNGMIYVGGTYNSIGGQPRDGFAALDLSTGLADPFAPTNALGAAALISLGGRIYAGNGVDPHFENRGFGGLACFIPAATVDVPDLGPGIEPTLRLSPNPARGATNLDFTLPRSGHVSIEVFDVQGRSVEQPVNREYEAGPHRVSWDGASHGAGLYFVRFSALGRTITRRAILIR